MLKFLSYFAAFYLGRLSWMIWENGYLEDKRKQLRKNADDIIAYGEDLSKREALLKEKSKEILNTIGTFKSEINGTESKWDNDDDFLLEQWSKIDG